VSVGTLVAFTMVAISLLIVRYVVPPDEVLIRLELVNSIFIRFHLRLQYRRFLIKERSL